MARMYHILVTVVGAITLLHGVVGHAGESPTPVGEVSFSGTVTAPQLVEGPPGAKAH